MTTTQSLPSATDLAPDLASEIAAVIAAGVHLTCGPDAQVTSVTLQSDLPVSMDASALIWSLEGRRQIYTSHKVR